MPRRSWELWRSTRRSYAVGGSQALRCWSDRRAGMVRISTVDRMTKASGLSLWRLSPNRALHRFGTVRPRVQIPGPPTIFVFKIDHYGRCLALAALSRITISRRTTKPRACNTASPVPMRTRSDRNRWRRCESKPKDVQVRTVRQSRAPSAIYRNQTLGPYLSRPTRKGRGRAASSSTR